MTSRAQPDTTARLNNAWPQTHRAGAYLATIVTEEEARLIKHREASPDRAAAALASRQLGVITTGQLALVGLSRRTVPLRVARGQLTRIMRGVYLWGAPPGAPGALELAACLVCGPKAVVSHGSAAWLWGLAKPSDLVELSVLGGHPRHRPGLVIHRVGALDPADVADVRGIPVTAPARTIADLAGNPHDDEVERMLSDAYARQLVTEPQLRASLARAAGRTGVPALRRLLKPGPTITRARSERLLLRIVRDAGLPRPKMNVRIEGKRVDAWWPEHNLIVEIDGYTVHGHRQAFEADRATDQRLVAVGYRVMRVTWRQLIERPLLVAANLSAALRMGA